MRLSSGLPIRSWNVLSILGVLLVSGSGQAQPNADFFEKKIRPLLVEKCYSCHAEEKQRGGLRVDSLAAMLEGGDRGPTIVPGKPEASFLLRTLAHDGEVKMPPKNKLEPAEIAAVTEWVKSGAVWPNAKGKPVEAATPSAKGPREFTAEERNYWAFQPVKPIDPPRVRETPETVANGIDRFLLAKLQENGLSFAPPADPRTLIRRVTFDLTGLPPTPEEIEAFVKDPSFEAYQRIIDRLLASPAYGEKWGRRWLDLARYADSNGMDENLAYVNAWRYRDWVIRGVNADMPYDQFIREQLAGDLIPGGTHQERADRITATGFLVIGPKMLAEDDPMKMRMDIIDEQLDTIGQSILGLTFGCARCHDHKFDPVTAADYYALAGIFYSTTTMKTYNVVATWNERSLSTPEQTAAYTEYEKRLAKAKSASTAANRKLRDIPDDQRAAAKKEADRLKKELAEIEKARPEFDAAMAVQDGKSEDIKIHLRGNHLTLGDLAPRRFPEILSGKPDTTIPGDHSGRLELAEWLTRPDHPLTARVMVNRIWAGHFGTGLVRTPDNFGSLGERPTHPQLLDWLAVKFVESGWSLKAMHRLMVTSAAYRMSVAESNDIAETDPENRLYSHFNRRRLTAEEVRDGMLAIAGLLDRTAGGTLLKVNPRQYINSTGSKRYDAFETPRRSVYLPVICSGVFDVLHTLDFPDPSVSTGQRSTSTIPTQALLMLNSSLADHTSDALATGVMAANTDGDARIEDAFRRVLGRSPTIAERDRVKEYLKDSIASSKAGPAEKERLAWRGFCRVLLASNEFVFVE